MITYHRLMIYKFYTFVELSPMNSRHFDHHPTLHHRVIFKVKSELNMETIKFQGFALRNSIIDI